MYDDSMTLNEGTVNNCEQSETESEISDRETERQSCLSSTVITLEGFRSYLNWFKGHKVAIETLKSGWVEDGNGQGEISLNDLLGQSSRGQSQRRSCYVDRGSSAEDDSVESNGSEYDGTQNKPERRKFTGQI